jgi:hypothetical protein
LAAKFTELTKLIKVVFKFFLGFSMTLRLAPALCIGVFVAGCGGASSTANTGGNLSTVTLSGTAAIGAPISNTVLQVKCLGTTEGVVAGTTTTGADGRYAIALVGARKPCLLELTTTNGLVLHAVSNDLTGIANITPLTEALAGSVLNQQDLSVLFQNLDSTLLEGIKAKVTAASVSAAWDSVKAALVSKGLDVTGVTSEPTIATLSASSIGQGNAYDALLDSINALSLPSGSLYQMAGGSQFVKMDENGAALAIQAAQWADSGTSKRGTSWDCVLDNKTGLYWEVKRNDPNHRRYQGHLYSWYDPARWLDDLSSTPTKSVFVNITGGSAGFEDSGILNSCKGVSNAGKCNTQSYVDAVNSSALCGFRDWVVPDAYTLQGLLKDTVRGPMIDTDFFPNTLSSSGSSISYWSGSPSANNSAYAWHVNFSSGRVEDGLKSSARPVRLVRGVVATEVNRDQLKTCDSSLSSSEKPPLTNIPASRPDTRYTVNDSTVIDKLTGLEWQRCVLGLSGTSCDQGSAATRTLADAKHDAETAGNGWRLPTRNELSGLVERKCTSRFLRGIVSSDDKNVDGALNLNAFPQSTGTTTVWSSTPNASFTEDTWFVNFYNGFVGFITNTSALNVRLVRETP